jgi:streptogrisin C
MPQRFAIIALLVAGTAGAARVQTAEEAIAADARWYARSQGLSQEEAVRRLRIQSEMGGLISQLRKTYKARLAGIVIDHQPVYRVRVRLTGTLPVAAQEHKLGGSLLPVVFEIGAEATLEELLTAMRVHLDALKRLFPTLAGLGTDERTSEIVLDVYAPTAAEADVAKAKLVEARALLGVPVRIDIANAYPTLQAGTRR